MPAVLSCAERLIDPCKQPPDARAAVSADRLRTLTAADLGDGPWGTEASPTSVGDVRLLEVERVGEILDGPVASQVERLVSVLEDRGVLDPAPPVDEVDPVAPPSGADGPVIAVVVEANRERLTRELLGAAARLAGRLPGRVAAIGTDLPAADVLAGWGAEDVVTDRGRRRRGGRRDRASPAGPRRPAPGRSSYRARRGAGRWRPGWRPRSGRA